MLTTLIIKDFAIIDLLELSFEKGMSVLSGETGAGKSIVIDALNLLLGGRASTEVIRTGSDRAEVQGAFDLAEPLTSIVAERLDAAGLSVETTLIVRRVVSRSGRNRVFVNGSLANVSTLRSIMRGVVDISGQHEHYSLLDTSRHIHIVDRFAGLAETLAPVQQTWTELSTLREELTSLKEAARERLSRIDYLKYQLREIEEAALKPDEEEALEEELQVLRHYGSIQEAVFLAQDRLYDGSSSVIEQIDTVSSELTRMGRRVPDLGRLAAQLEQARIVVDDVVRELRHYDDMEADPGRLDEVASRLDQLDRLKRKYGREIPEIIEDSGAMQAELNRLENAESQIERFEQDVARLHTQFLEQARVLSAHRTAAARRLEGMVERGLERLAMGVSDFCVHIHTDESPETWRSTGIDRVELLLAPNPGEEAKPLARIASGGELSRVMLAIKQALVSTDEVATYVFDEVDAGIGGAVAEHVARTLRQVSLRGHQVLCITHLATIAAYADHHFQVEKRVVDERTVTDIKRLDEQNRVHEIARMLGGLSITERTLEHAAEMVQKAHAHADG